MKTHIDFAAIQQLLTRAEEAGRKYLFEYEVYDLIRHSGSETPPAYFVLRKNRRLKREDLDTLPGEKVVVKVISAYILHKSDVGGVRVVAKTVGEVLSAVRSMDYDIATAYRRAAGDGKFDVPGPLAGCSPQELENRVRESIEGVILCQYMHPDSQEFGNELLVSLRRTREFGMIISAGLGGTDTELYAQRFRKGQAVVAASVEMVSGEQFFTLFKKTISYKKMAGLTRGQKRIVTDEQLIECFSAFVALGRYFSPVNVRSPYVIDELEINPFAFSSYLMLPLDGLCRFSTPQKTPPLRPVAKIEQLLHPSSIALAGVSSRGMNIGRIILQNIVSMGFSRENVLLIHPSAKMLDGIQTVASLKKMPQRVDLLILAVGGEAVPAMIEEVMEGDLADAVIVVAGDMGQGQKGQERLEQVLARLESYRGAGRSCPVLLGGNSLGVLSHPGGYDSLFIPESKLPKNHGRHQRRSALVSQSGAYMITRMSKLSFLDPAYALSIGNQLDISAGDFLEFMKDIDGLDTIAFYIEGFADLDGLHFSQAVRRAIPAGKEIVFYKAGRTTEGKTAMSGHTASIAGDYMVCESCVSQAGAFIAENFSDFEGLLRLSRTLHDREISGNRLAAVSNAGYEAVGIADNLLGEDYSLKMAVYHGNSRITLEGIIKDAGLDFLVKIANPLDVTPMATEEVYAEIVRVLLEDDNVDHLIIAIVPLTPILHTLPEEEIAMEAVADGRGIVDRIAHLNSQGEKPLVLVVDSGSLYDHLADALEDQGLPVFRSADQAVRVLGKYVQNRLSLRSMKVAAEDDDLLPPS